MLLRLYNKYTKGRLDVYWWRGKTSGKLNFGDEITPLVIEKLWGYRCHWTPPEHCRLAGAGSIIEVLQNKANGNEIEVWGSGFIKEGGKNENTNLKFRAVRGGLSQNRVDGSPVLGDPGLLMPLVVKPAPSRRFKYGILPHYADRENPLVNQLLISLPNSTFIDVYSKPNRVAKEISSCEIILSSSLHGLILADAYQVMSLRLDISRKVIGRGYKFNDYATSVARSIPTITTADMRGFGAGQIERVANKAESAVVGPLQKRLIDSFPF